MMIFLLVVGAGALPSEASDSACVVESAPVDHSLASCPHPPTQQREPQAEMLTELYLEHYPERYDEVIAWCENSGFTMDSAVKGSQSHFEVLLRCYSLLLREAARQRQTAVSCTSV
ncbi:hypothetical protein ACOMHN_011485 [Nucella lapillus]